MSIPRNQKYAMAAIVLAGAAAIIGLLFAGPGSGSRDSGKDPQAEHQDEAMVRLTDAQIDAADIQVTLAGPGKIAESKTFPGEIRFNDDRTAHVVTRLAGLVESVPVNLGQQVTKGMLLAVIASPALSDQRSELLAAERRLSLASSTFDREKSLWEQKISAQQDYLQAQTALEEARIAAANAAQKLRGIGAPRNASSLNRFELRAPFDGMIVQKHLALGEAVGDSSNAFTISDLNSVWAEFAVAPQDLALVRVGEHVAISSTALHETADGVISYVGSLLGEQTRTATARVTLANPAMAWRPGLFITVKAGKQEKNVPLMVRATAVQTIGDSHVVFARVPSGFIAQPIRTGRSDGTNVEVLEGLAPGTLYATTNAFTLKAELGKASIDDAH
jgi:cobalt-zinc-cadmium efflux system membrane fusion protein